MISKMRTKRGQRSKRDENFYTRYLPAIDPSQYLDKDGNQQFEKRTQAAANELGFYFEACVLKKLCTRGGKNSKPEFSGPQRRAIALMQYLRGIESSKAIEQITAVETAADQIVESLMEYLEKEFPNKKDYKFKVQDVDVMLGTGQGSPLGDLILEIEGQKIVLELKWQSSRYTPTHWFNLSDRSLFGDDNYAKYLIDHGHWNNNEPKQSWDPAFRVARFLEYLKNNKYFGDSSAQAQINYFIQKGERMTQGKEGDWLSKNQVHSKLVLHASYRGVQLTTTDELLSQFANAAQGENMLLPHLSVEQWNQAIVYAVNDNPAAALTIKLSNSGNGENGNGSGENTKETKKRKAEQNIGYDFWIAQRILGYYGLK